MRNRTRKFLHSLTGQNAGLVFFAVAALTIIISAFLNSRADFSDFAARHFTNAVNRRFGRLEAYMDKAASESPAEWLDLDGLPEDMVVYRYAGDSLQSWCNQFSLDNDDIGDRVVVQRFTNLRYNLVSPLSEADDAVKFMNIGPKWYLVKAVPGAGGSRIIGGLEVRNTLDSRSINGVNPKFRLSDRFSLQPIGYSGGSAISVEGYPLMKIIQETTRVMPILPDATMIWVSVAFMVLGIMLYLHFNRTRKVLGIAVAALTVIFMAFYFFGYGMQGSSSLFSPTIYADGPVLYSLGAVLIINIWITLLFFSAYMVRKEIMEYVCGKNARHRMALLTGFTAVLCVLLLVYITCTFRSLVLNSNVGLELYRITQLGRYSLYIYLSYLALISAMPLALQAVRVPVHRLFGLKYNMFSRSGRTIFSLTCALYFMSMFSILGSEKEFSREEIWVNRLSIDRDLGLELQLRGIEKVIEADNSIPEVIFATRDYRVILNRITETYMSRISKDYDVSLYLYKDKTSDPQVLRFIDERILNGEPIAADSRFCYSRNTNGRAQYAAMFVYYTPDKGSMKMLLGINSKADREERGYSFILDSGTPGSVIIPPLYSYAKYIDGKLVSYKGDYPYPTILTGKFAEDSGDSEFRRTAAGAYVHFFSHVAPDEMVILSRPRISILQYVLAASIICLLTYFWISLCALKRKRRGEFEKNYYKSRVNTVLFLSMLMTLVTMSVIMVFFVYKRNDANVMRLMSSKISTIQSLMENKTRMLHSFRDMPGGEMSAIIDDIASYTRSDITLYSPGGKVFNTTAPEIFENMVIGSRTNDEAYRNIMYNNKRYYIHKEHLGGRTFYTMYAPVFNDEGKVLAILSAPYTDSGLSFKADAIFHSVFVLAVFFILLIITRFFTTRVVDKMFRPIVEMGRKMVYARTAGLEYIIYDKEDEISGLVRAYNLMVHDLSESGKQVAQAERERAWSEMARQVAHEIKNPLTPMKLQIQRLIRLKSRNDPSWETKFDDISRLVLDSIDVLTDTANEFSTFAKLYTEEMVPINLDSMASDQISMFDDKDNITFQYFGLKDANVMGPKPQLIRVFVNLLTNAVQAIENQQTEDREAGREPQHGQIILSVRNSTKEGFYDIVVEDNGPGIPDGNRSKLFTPNFTTKSSGTGLGLAICRNILERCGGEIFYSRSFSLKGACFTVRFPKNNVKS